MSQKSHEYIESLVSQKSIKEWVNEALKVHWQEPNHGQESPNIGKIIADLRNN